MQKSEYRQLVEYISNFYETVDKKLNFLGAHMKILRDHMTGLYGLDCNVCDIPSATGHLRLKQMACLKLLRMIDARLKSEHIQYFLSYGNLLGAYRTGGFIPWDDDVDICLMRDDFNRAVKVLEKYFNCDGLETRFGISGRIFKVIFNKQICVDLFPWDYYYKRMDCSEIDDFKLNYDKAMNVARIMEAEQQKISEYEGRNIRDVCASQTNYTTYDEIRDDIIMQHHRPDIESGDIFEGIDWQTYPERMAGFYHHNPFRHEWIFPLGVVNFCGYDFPAPNNIDAFLTTRFGDWRAFKPDFSRHSNKGFSWEDYQLISSWVKEEQK